MMLRSHKTSLLALFVSFCFSTCLFADGAGVLPYVKDGKQIYFLLAEDNRRLGSWTDFGGRGPAIEKTAAKEFGLDGGGAIVFGKKDPLKNRKKIREITRKHIGRKQGVMRIQLGNFVYKMYLMDVTPFVEKAGGRRKIIRSLRLNGKRVRKRMRRLKLSGKRYDRKLGRRYRAYAHNTDFAWVSRDHLLWAAHTPGTKIEGRELSNLLRENIQDHVRLLKSL